MCGVCAKEGECGWRQGALGEDAQHQTEVCGVDWDFGRGFCDLTQGVKASMSRGPDRNGGIKPSRLAHQCMLEVIAALKHRAAQGAWHYSCDGGVKNRREAYCRRGQQDKIESWDLGAAEIG